MKRCILCKYFNISFPTCGYSEMTPGTEGSMSCTLGVGIFPSYSYNYRKLKSKKASTGLIELSETDFFEATKAAETCESYVERSE